MPRSIRRRTPAIFTALFLLAAAAAFAAQDASPLGDWEGTLAAGGQSLPLVFHVTEDGEGALAATLDSPSQGGFGLEASEASFEDGAITLVFADIAGRYEATLGEEGDTFAGTWSQGGMSFDLVLTRAEPEGG